MQPYTSLRVAEQARIVIKAAYAFTRTLPKEEMFVLSSQMRRAAMSIGLNIAEGASRQTTKELIRFLEIARGSGMELHFATIASEDLDLGRAALRVSLMKEVEIGQRQLSALISSLRRRASAGTRR